MKSFHEFCKNYPKYNDTIRFIAYVIYLDLLESSTNKISLKDSTQLGRYIVINNTEVIIPIHTMEKLNFKRYT